MNSIIEAQQEFTNCFGDLCLSDLLGHTQLPHFSNERIEMDHFIDTHQNPAPVVIPIDFTEDQYGTKHYIYTP